MMRTETNVETSVSYGYFTLLIAYEDFIELMNHS